MSEAMINSINMCLDTWEPRKNFVLADASAKTPQSIPGVLV